MWWGYRPWWNYPAGYWYLRPWYRYQSGFWSIAPSPPAMNESDNILPPNGPPLLFPNAVPPGPDEAARAPFDVTDPRVYGDETDDPVLRRYRVGRGGFWYGESRFIR